MQRLFIKVSLSVILTASLLSCLFNFTFERPPEPKKQTIVIEASGHGVPLIVHLWGWITGWRSGSGGSGKSPMPKPGG